MDIKLHTDRIHSIVQANSGNDAAADDIYQECCLRVLERHDQWSPLRGSFDAWLGTVVRNVIRSWHKRENLRSRDGLLNNSRIASRVRQNSDEHDKPDWADTDTLIWMLRAIKNLPTGQREVLILHYYDDLGTYEIAKELDITPSAVSHRLNRALENLRRQHRRHGLMMLIPWPLNFKNWTPFEVLTVKSFLMSVCVGGALSLGGVTLPHQINSDTQNTPLSVHKRDPQPIPLQASSPTAAFLLADSHQNLQRLLSLTGQVISGKSKSHLTPQQAWDNLQGSASLMNYAITCHTDSDKNFKLYARPRFDDRQPQYCWDVTSQLQWSVTSKQDTPLRTKSEQWKPVR